MKHFGKRAWTKNALPSVVFIKYGSVWRQLWLALFLLRGFILVRGS